MSYSNSAGLIELRKGLVEKYYRKIGIDIDVPELIVTVAGSEGVNLSLQITCDEGDEVIVLEPFYTNYNTFAFMNGITLKAVHTDIRNGFKVPDMAEFEKHNSPYESHPHQQSRKSDRNSLYQGKHARTG